MSIKYHKPFKEGRALGLGRGPRDLQRDKILRPTVSVDNTDLVEELRAQINLLREELQNQKVQKGYSAEEFDVELIKTTKQIIIDVENKSKDKLNKLKKIITDYESKIEILNNKLISAEEIIKTKDDSIAVLKTNVNAIESTDPDRPQMEEAFVDPLEKGIDQNLELHIKIKEDIQGDTKVDAKVDKLKSLLGKSPLGG